MFTLKNLARKGLITHALITMLVKPVFIFLYISLWHKTSLYQRGGLVIIRIKYHQITNPLYRETFLFVLQHELKFI